MLTLADRFGLQSDEDAFGVLRQIEGWMLERQASQLRELESNARSRAR